MALTVPETTQVEKGHSLLAKGMTADRDKVLKDGDEGRWSREAEAARALTTFRQLHATQEAEIEALRSQMTSLTSQVKNLEDKARRLQEDCERLHEQVPELKNRLRRCQCGANLAAES